MGCQQFVQVTNHLQKVRGRLPEACGVLGLKRGHGLGIKPAGMTGKRLSHDVHKIVAIGLC